MNDMMEQSEVDNMLGKLSAFADYIRNSLINASELAKTVSELQVRVSQLQSTVEQTEQANRTLNETVQSLTEQRNAVVNERDEWRNKHAQLDYEHEALRHDHDTANGIIRDLQFSLDNTKEALNQERELTQRLGNENALLQERLRRTQRYIDNMKATLAGEQTRDDNGHFEELPKVAQGW